MACSALALLEEGFDPETPVTFTDAQTGGEEQTTLAAAAACVLAGLGEVVEMRGRPAR
jgi:hypothetical protein